jgi:hypothetical protein
MIKLRATDPEKPAMEAAPVCELLILSDGTVLAHNLTPAMASVLRVLNPADETLKERALGSPDSSAPPPQT